VSGDGRIVTIDSGATAGDPSATTLPPGRRERLPDIGQY
jgi:hypothetical protein